MTPNDDQASLAIVGFAARYPGAADADAYWELLCSGRSGLTPVAPEHDRVAKAGLLPFQLDFDPAPFGMTARESARLDPQQRVFLECAWHAIEHAGHGDLSMAGETGVFTGAANSQHLWLAHPEFDPTGGDDPVRNLDIHTNHIADYLPMRVAHRLGATGPTLSVGATCATSLVAVHVAAASLLSAECDTAIAGGVSLRLPENRGYSRVPDGPYSPDGATRAYSSRAAGTVFTQGCGVVVLRRLEEAIADGDTIHAVLRSTALTNDGPERISFTAPTAAGQARAIAQALAMAQRTPRDIEYVAGHGTATALGDQIEIEALRQVFGTARRPWCTLGSTKAAIGHADSAAGVAGLIAAIYAVRHGVIPGSRDCEPVSPAVSGDSPFTVSATSRPWTTERRTAGVSSFGIGGVNVHAIVENFPQPTPPTPPTATPSSDSSPSLLLVSGATARAAADTADAVGAYIEQHPDDSKSAEFTLRTGRRELSDRIALVYNGNGLQPTTVSGRATGNTQVIWTFSGGGAPTAGYAAQLYRQSETFATTLDTVAQLISHESGVDVRDVLLATGSELTRWQHLQRDPRWGLPSVFALSVATAATLTSHGLEPDVVLGHSLGEYTAAWMSGMLSLPDAARLVCTRASAMSRMPAGRMVAVALDEASLEGPLQLHPQVEIAAVNGPHATVVAGPTDAIAGLLADLARAGVEYDELDIDVAAHTAAVEPVVELLDAAASRMPLVPSRIPLYSTLTAGLVLVDDLATAGHWGRHLRSPVRYRDTLRAILTANDSVSTVLVQIGPGAALVSVARTLDSALTTVTTLDSPDTTAADLLETVGAAWVAGAPLRRPTLTPPLRRIPLPSYRFDRLSLGIQSPGPGHQSQSDSGRDDHSARCWIPVWRPTPASGATGVRTTHVVLLTPEISDCASETSTQSTVASAVRLDFEATSSQLRHELAPHERVSIVVDMRAGSSLTSLMSVLGRIAQAVRAVSTQVRLLLLTESAEAVLPGERSRTLLSATHALPRVLAQECERITWCCVDVDASVPMTAVLECELERDDSEEVAWRSASDTLCRYSRGFDPWSARTVGESPVTRTGAPARVVLVTGGVGTLGLAITEHLIGQGVAAVVILTSRRGLDSLDQPGTQRLQSLREALGTLGGDLAVVAADSTDPLAIATLVTGIVAAHGRIDIVVHAPVVVELALLDEFDEQTLSAMWDTKVNGRDILAAACADLPNEVAPALGLAISSVGATVGGAGLGAYVAASRALESMPQAQPQSAGTQWCTVSLDRISTGTADERNAASEISMRHSISAESAAAALWHLATALTESHAAADQNARLWSPPGTIVVSPGELESRARALPTRAKHPTGAPDPSRDLTTARALTPTEAVVARCFTDAVGAPVRHPDDDFFAFGGHSLLATRVLRDLEATIAAPIRLRDLLGAPTVGGLAAIIDRQGGMREPSDASGPESRTDRAEPRLAVSTAVSRQSEQGRFPLTWVQHAYRVGRDRPREAGGGVGCHFYVEHLRADDEVGSTFDPTAYNAAWNLAIATHPMLRAVVEPDGTNHVLERVPRYRLPIHRVDHLDRAAQEIELERFRSRLANRVADPAVWPLITPEVMRTSTGWHIGISVDVLVCDSASYHLVDALVRHNYAELISGRTPTPEPPTVTFADCVSALAGRRSSDRYERDRRYWGNRAADIPASPAISNAPSALTADSSGGRFSRLAGRVDAAVWSTFTNRCADEGVTPTSGLLACFGEILNTWSGSDHFTVTLTVFDRPDELPGAESVVGEFSSLVLHELDFRGSHLDSSQRSRQTRQAVNARLFDDLDHRSYPGPAVLADRARAGRTDEAAAVVFTSMLGLHHLPSDAHHDGVRTDGVRTNGGHDTEWLGPIVHGVSQTPQVWLDHQAYEHRGELVLQWDVNTDRIDLETATRFFAAYREALCAAGSPAVGSPAEGPGPTNPTPRPCPDQASQADGDAVNARITTGVSEIWSELLERPVEELELHQTFLAAGGDSLLVVRMGSLIRERLGVIMRLNDIGTESTIATMSALIEERSAGSVRAPAVAVTPRPDRSATTPLPPLAQAYFVGNHTGWALSYPTVHYLTDVGLSQIESDTVVDELTDALDRLVDHQAGLRMRVTEHGRGRTLAVGDPNSYITLQHTDLRSLGPVEQARRCAQIRDATCQSGPDPRVGPGVSVHLILLGAGRGRLVCAFSLLVVDGWSAAVFERELMTMLANPNAILAPLSIDAGDYATALEQLRDTDEWRADHRWWMQRVPDLPYAPAVPTTVDAGAATADIMAGAHRVVSRDAASALSQLCRAHSVTVTAAVAAAYSIAIAEVAGHRRFLLTTLSSHRQPLHADIERIIGAFSSTALLVIDLPSTTVGDAVAAVSAELSATRAHDLVSGVEVIRELRRHRGASRIAPSPFVFQSTLGLAGVIGERRVDAGPLGRIDTDDVAHHIRTPQVHCELRVFDGPEASIVLDLAFVAALFPDGQMVGVLDRVAELIHELTDPAGWAATPSWPALRDRESIQPVHDDRDPSDIAQPAPSPALMTDGLGITGHDLRPAEELITSVTDWWTTELGAPIGSGDDLFAAGVDSLHLIRAVAELSRRYQVSISLSMLLDHPTPTGFASAVAAGAPVIELRPATLRGHGDTAADGSTAADAVTLVLIHPSGGDTAPYRGLVAGLAPGPRVIAIADYGHRVSAGVDQLADCYARVIDTAVPHGDIVIGGWSMGGIIAHEVACRFRRAAAIRAVVLIDAQTPDRITVDVDDSLARRMFTDSVRAVSGLDERDALAIATLTPPDASAPHGGSVRARLQLFAEHLQALADHHATPLPDVDVILLRSTQRSPHNSGIGMGVDDCIDLEANGWSDLCHPLTVIDVAAHHYSILAPEHLPEIVTVIDRVLGTTETSAGSHAV